MELSDTIDSCYITQSRTSSQCRLGSCTLIVIHPCASWHPALLVLVPCAGAWDTAVPAPIPTLESEMDILERVTEE